MSPIDENQTTNTSTENAMPTGGNLPTPTTSEQPVIIKSSKNRKALVILGVIFGALLLISGSFFLHKRLSPNDYGTSNEDGESNPSISLKTYTSEIAGVSFDYPSNWTLEDGKFTSWFPPKELSDVKDVVSPTGIRVKFVTSPSFEFGISDRTHSVDIFVKKEGTPKSPFFDLVGKEINVTSWTLDKNYDLDPLQCPNIQVNVNERNENTFIALSSLTGNANNASDLCGYILTEAAVISLYAIDRTPSNYTQQKLMFVYYGVAITDEIDRQAVVDMLSSLRKN